jgi:phospholipid transport system substrate-binding protein
MIRRRFMATVLAFGAVPALALAQAKTSPEQPIAALNDGLLKIMHAGKSTAFDTRMASFTPVVVAAFDLPLILQNSVGPGHWADIMPAERATLLEVFTQFTVASYVANFDSFSGETFTLAPELRHVGRDVVVQTRIVGTTGDMTRLDYVMREIDGGWHIVDILLDGTISRVAVTRSDFRSMLAEGGAARLIASLRAKVASLKAGDTP